jgi:hypothetical protein
LRDGAQSWSMGQKPGRETNGEQKYDRLHGFRILARPGNENFLRMLVEFRSRECVRDI